VFRCPSRLPRVVTPASATWARSLPTVVTVLRLVADQYPVHPLNAILIRSFNNDVFRIDTDAGPLVLKVYRADRFTADEVRWEQQLARHLVNAGLPVPADVTLRNGDSVGVLDAPEGERPFALTEWLPGVKPEPPWTDDLYRSVGSILARFPRRSRLVRQPFPSTRGPNWG